jgi:hypothetical protein
MPTCFLAPDPIQSTQFIPGGNTPANGGQLFFYMNETTTKQTVYKDPLGATAWSNPIVLDSGGNLPSGGEVWFPESQTFTVVFAPSTDADPPTSPYWTKDDLTGINDISQSSGEEWTAAPTPTFINAQQFSMIGDQTAAGAAEVNRRVKFSVTGPPTAAYGVIRSASSAAGSTQVVMNMTIGTLDAGLSAASYGILTAINPSVPIFGGNAYGTSEASAAAIDIYNNGGDYAHITGTNSITSFGTAARAGLRMNLLFDSTCVIVPGANLTTQGNINLVMSQGDRIEVVAESTTAHRVIGIYKANPDIIDNFINGLGLSRNAGTNTSVDISAGMATDSQNTRYINLSSGITKTQTTFSVGMSSGAKLSSAQILTDSWYAWYLLYNITSGISDIGFSGTFSTFASNGTPILPDSELPNSTWIYRYIGCTRTTPTSSSWVAWRQDGVDFVYQDTESTMDNAASAVSTASRQLLRVNVPPVRVKWKGVVAMTVSGIQSYGLMITDPQNLDTAPGFGTSDTWISIGGSGTSGVASIGGPHMQWTNTSGQIGVRATGAQNVWIYTKGWMDYRGFK